MYSVVLVAAMATSGHESASHLCPVSPSVYGVSIWSKCCFFESCAPARYGWVDCNTKGFGYYPGIGHRHGCVGCTGCGGCFGCAGFGCGGWGHHHGGYSCGGCVGGGCGGWGAYGGTWFSPAGPWAHGAGYAGFSGYGNFGVYGAVASSAAPLMGGAPMPASYAPIGDYTIPGSVTPGLVNPSLGTPGVRPPIPAGPSGISPLPPPSEKPEAPAIPPAKPNTDLKPTPASVILVVPENSQVLVDGRPLRSTESERLFLTPAIETNKQFFYTVKVTAKVGDKEFNESKKILVTGGQVTKVTFEEIISQVKAEQTIISTSGK